MAQTKTARIPYEGLKNLRLLGRLAEYMKAPSRKVLIGPKGGGLPEGAERVIGEWGGLDYDLLGAKRLRDRLRKAGYEGDLQLGGADAPDVDRIHELSSEMPGLVSAFKRKTPEEFQQAFAAKGVNLSPEQASALVGQSGPVRSAMRTAKDLYVGEAPFLTTYQRFQQGGLLGKGGVLFGEAAPGGHIGRGFSRAADAARRGEYLEAAKKVPYGGTLGYGLNVGFGYGMPGWLGYEAFNAAQQSGQDPIAALGASATSSLGATLAAPLGFAQMHMFGPIERASQKLWGIDPPTAAPPMKPTPKPAAPMQVPYRQIEPADPSVRALRKIQQHVQPAQRRSTGYESALEQARLLRGY